MVLVVLALLTLFPVMLVVSTALKTDARTCGVNPFGLFTVVLAGEPGRGLDRRASSADYLVNSILLRCRARCSWSSISTMAGYAFARLPFPGRTVMFYLVVLGLLVPFFTYMIPLYFQLRSMGLLDTLLGAILVLTLDRDLVRHLLHAGVLLRPARASSSRRPGSTAAPSGRSSSG